MDKRDTCAPDGGLDSRESEILRSVLKAHILHGEPVGSKTVAAGLRIDLSPSTIRNVMATLEDRGLLRQPHRSAGRVPTDIAYRLYVDHWMHPPKLQRSKAEEIDAAMQESQGEIADLLAEASRQLSQNSGNVGIVLAPEMSRIVLERVEFVRVAAGRMVAILIDRSGVVHNRFLTPGGRWDQAELDQMGAYLSEQFSGMTLPAMYREVQRRLREDRAHLDRIKRRSMILGEKTLEGGDGKAGIFVEGASKIMDSPDFADILKMKALFRALDEKKRLVDLLANVLGSGGVQVSIGRENRDAALDECALVASSYRAGDYDVGTVGIVGPTRMEYARTIALVDHLAGVLTRFLSGTGPEKERS